MYRLQLRFGLALAAVLLPAIGTTAENEGRAEKRGSSAVPPVLRNSEPADTSVVMLPGAPVVPTPVLRSRGVAAKAAPALPPVPILPAAPPERTPLPILRPQPLKANAGWPAEFGADSATFCQKQVGRWTEAKARELLGSPRRQRPSLADEDVENGRILAFADPTGRYRELELDFAGRSARLRTVFAYPWKMTWQECRRLWSGRVSATKASKGRTFYSYEGRRLDVLVDPGGQVISLGLY